MKPRRLVLPTALAALALVAAAARATIPFDPHTVTTDLSLWPAAYVEGFGSGLMMFGTIRYDNLTHVVRRTWTESGTHFYSDSILLGVNPGRIAARTDRYDDAVHACFYLEIGGQGYFSYATSTLTGPWTVQTVRTGAHAGELCAIDHRTDIGPVIAYVDPSLTPGTSTLRYASRELGFWVSQTLDAALGSNMIASPTIATNKQSATHVAWINHGTNTIRYCPGPGTTVETVASAAGAGMAVVAVDRSGNPHVAYSQSGALVIADRVGGVWQPDTVLPASRDVRAFAFAYGYDRQPYVVFTTGDTEQPLQCATPFFGDWLVQSIGSDGAFAAGQVPALAVTSGADPRGHLLAVWNAFGLEMAWDDPFAYSFTRARLAACPDSDLVSTVRIWNTVRYPLDSGPVTLDFTAGPVWDSTYVCSDGLTYLSRDIGADTTARFTVKASGTIATGVGVRYGGSTGTLIEPSAALAGVDQNGDGVVTPADRDLLISRYGTRDPRSDLNFDGLVDSLDREILLAHLWHGCTLTDVPPGPRHITDLALAIAPNPARRMTLVTLSLPQAGAVRVEVLDAAGRRVRVLHVGALEAGTHPLLWDGVDDAGRPLRSGLYLVRATAGARSAVARLAHIR